MAIKYDHLLSPINVNGVQIRNRIIASACSPHFVQGDEKYLGEGLLTHFANKARDGAGIVICKHRDPVVMPDTTHTNHIDIYHGPTQHYMCQMADAVHYYGAKAMMFLFPPNGDTVPGSKFAEFDCSAGIPAPFVAGDGSTPRVGKEAPEEVLMEVLDLHVKEAILAKEMGYDGIFLPMPYRMGFIGRFLSPMTNHRTDKYGGSMENRARYPLMIFKAIKDACGPNFLIETSVSGDEHEYPDGKTIDETVYFANAAKGLIDILQIRGGQIDLSNAVSAQLCEMPHLDLCAQIKAKGTDMLIDCVCGCHDPEKTDEVIAKGQADFIGIGRGLIADGDYVKKVYQGFGEDVRPCLRCQKCHQIKPGLWLSNCSVNPKFGIEHRVDRFIAPKGPAKKVAIVGGGAAGLNAVLYLTERGHDVTVYEKEDHLGGQLYYAGIPDIKWTTKRYTDWLIRQAEKSGAKILLNTEATVDVLNKEGYDVVFAAPGSVPVVPAIPGIDGKNVFTALDVLENPDLVSGKIAIIGGGEIGVETGIYLAKKGKKPTVIEMKSEMAQDAPPVHCRVILMDIFDQTENLSGVVNAKCTAVTEKGVSYIDADGKEQLVEADYVVLASGMKPKYDVSGELSKVKSAYYIIGDCAGYGSSILNATKTAFGMSNQI